MSRLQLDVPAISKNFKKPLFCISFKKKCNLLYPFEHLIGYCIMISYKVRKLINVIYLK